VGRSTMSVHVAERRRRIGTEEQAFIHLDGERPACHGIFITIVNLAASQCV
jgi:hypothetical protein